MLPAATHIHVSAVGHWQQALQSSREGEVSATSTDAQQDDAGECREQGGNPQVDAHTADAAAAAAADIAAGATAGGAAASAGMLLPSSDHGSQCGDKEV